jgi:hypothetical protein
MITDEWLSAVKQIMNVLQQQSLPTLSADGVINPQAYTYQPVGSRAVSSNLNFFAHVRPINYS